MSRFPHLRGLVAAVPAALLLFGCATQDPAAPTGLLRTANIGGTPGNGVADKNEVEVCKVGSTATIDAATASGTVTADFADGECVVMNTSFVSPIPETVTLTETVLPANTVLDSIVVFQGLAPNRATPLTLTKTVVTGSNTATALNGLELGALVIFYNRFVPPPPPPEGGQGCTPGYWKQSQHYDSYPAPYTYDTQFSAVFENAFPGMTLQQVMSTGGGGLEALGRHTVAALLNAASSGVSYDFTVADVIAGFNNTFPGSKNQYNTQKDIFAGFNEQGCPLN